MKISLLLLLFASVITSNASQTSRTFTSTDGKKTFQGKLMSFDKETETVSVMNSKGNYLSFSMKVLSTEDQEYVNENADKLPPNVSIRVAFDEQTERKGVERGAENAKTTKYYGGYSIRLNNYTPRDIDDVEVEYVVIYREDKVDGKHTDKLVTGSETVSLLKNQYATVDTNGVELTKYYKPGRSIVNGGGGGCRSCGGGGGVNVTNIPSERSRDILLGCVARIKVNGHVVAVSATSPSIQTKYQMELDSVGNK